MWFNTKKKTPLSKEVEVNRVYGHDQRPGNVAIIPNNDIARLMYYLHCVRNCVDIHAGSRLIDFRNHHLLSEVERRDVVINAHRYRPSVLRNIIFFEVDDNSYMCPDATNNFLPFDDPVVIGSFNLASNAITVDGEPSIIHKVMVYKDTWMHTYFEQPYAEEKWRIGLAPKPVYFVGVTRGSSPASAADVPLWCVSGAVCCFFIPPLGLALLIVGTCRAACEAARASSDDDRTTTYVVY